MKLEEIEIVNFRSIAHVNIVPNPSCQGFVGINESGKTNVLKAISLLSNDVRINKDDVRIEGIDEEREQESYVEFSFSLQDDEINEVIDELLAKIYAESGLPKISLANKKMDIKGFFSRKGAGFYRCDIKKGKKTSLYYRLNTNEDIPLPTLKKKKTSATVSINSKSGKAITLSQFNFIEADCIADENKTLFDECKTSDLNAVFGSLLTKYITEHLPDVVFWKYDDKNLLPTSVSIDDFKDDSDSCIPLKSMFYLAGYTEIEEVLTNALDQRPSALTNILQKVSRVSTEYLHQVWRNYKSVSFELRRDGANIDIHIKDAENFYDCSQRSDGFKRFITFLLALSARVKNGEIEGSIIVIDEPDLGIHILGQKDLLQELIRISKNNLVFFSTHSIFMIDRKEASRHFIVSKKDGITTIKRATESNYTDDEVLFNALGYSLFEALKQKNIVFEGWSDKKVYETARATKKGKELVRLNDTGVVHASGVKNIINIAKDIELANRDYFVLSDSDKVAQEKRKEYQEKEYCVGIWYTYGDLVPGIYTLEDFIRHTSFKKCIEDAQHSHSELSPFDYTAFSSQQYRREEYIKNWVRSTINDGEAIKTIIKEIKNDLYTNIKGTDIEDSYYGLLTALKERNLI